jgi:hypothetical protein
MAIIGLFCSGTLTHTLEIVKFSNKHREGEERSCPTPIGGRFQAIQAMGVRYHRRNYTELFKTTYIHTNCHRLFHEMGRDNPFDSCKQKGGDPIHRTTTDHKVWCAFRPFF